MNLIKFLKKQSSNVEQISLDYILKEKYYSPRPKAIGGCVAGSLDKNMEYVKRIVNAYQLAASEQLTLKNSMWSMFFEQRHKDVHEVFLKGDLNSAADILQNPGSTDLFWGFDILCRNSMPAILSDMDGYADAVLFGLIRLTEAMGGLRIYYPETSSTPRSLPDEIDHILKLLDKKFGSTVTFSNPFPGECGLLTSRGVLTYRDVQAIYQAWRIKQLVRNIPNPRVLEIGAGLGRTAYYARQLGILDYSIVDIPFTCLSSGYYLIQTLGADNVLLFGEKSEEFSNKAKVFPPSHFLNQNHTFDLIMNTDSMTEMDPSVARSYLEKIASNTKTFLSINHEFNPFTVQGLVEEDNRVLSIDRKPYWMRPGYVEELIQY